MVLNIVEVEVYDKSGINQALGKAAEQSSDHTSGSYPASNAVDGDPSTFSHTSSSGEHGK
eukprot:scaffold151320_cov23-Cyclotella_meneghiniana.AAC.1